MKKKKTITLTTRKQLDIFMNPQRQRLLKTLEISGPMTSKQLSDVLRISSSSVTHHIKQLEQLGLVELHHTETIHGIQAKYYNKLPVSVSMGGARDDDLKTERYALMDYIMSETWNGFKENMKNAGSTTNVMETGDFIFGVIHLKEQEARKLYNAILAYAKSHFTPGEDTIPWEYGLVAFPHQPEKKKLEE